MTLVELWKMSLHFIARLIRGHLIECPKHNGRFDITDGSAQRPPACAALRTYQSRVNNGRIFLNLRSKENSGPKPLAFKVVSNRNVATFIKELVLEPAEGHSLPSFQPGQYMQLDIPAYTEICFEHFDVPEPYATVWRAQHVFDFKAHNSTQCRRNYSLANHPGDLANLMRFNVRIATPPRGLDCSAGSGSAYIYSLKPGDTVTAIGPFGDFLIKDTSKEMIGSSGNLMADVGEGESKKRG